MQITLATDEIKVNRSLFKREPGYRVTLTVIFNEEERAIIKKSDLGTAYLRTDHFVGPQGPFDLPIKIKELQAGPVQRVFDPPQKAKLMEQELREIELPNLKVYLEENAGVETKSERFEL